jgi:hypothetical protein
MDHFDSVGIKSRSKTVILCEEVRRLITGGIMSTATPSPLRREPQLAGQTVVVIGGSAGIGLETI